MTQRVVYHNVVVSVAETINETDIRTLCDLSYCRNIPVLAQEAQPEGCGAGGEGKGSKQ